MEIKNGHTSDTNAIKDRVLQIQISRLIENSGINSIAGFLMALIWVGLMWKNLPHQVLGAWLSMMAVLFIFRVSVTYFSWYKPENKKNSTEILRRWYLLAVLITGAGWGITSVLMFPYTQTEQVALSFLLAGVAASGIALSHVAWVYYGYVGLALIPLMLRLFYIGGEIYYALCALTGLFLSVMIMTAYKMHALSSKELNLSFENVELISDLQSTQKNLESVNYELKDEIEHVKKIEIELKKAKDKAEQLSDVKSTFLAKMSHEIRTPMNGVVGTLQLLELTELEDKQKFYVKTASSSAASLMSILNDIMDISKIEAGKLHLEKIPFDIKRLVSDVITLNYISADQKQNTLHYEIDEHCPEMVSGDPTRLRQILVNLVSNAIKFTKRGSVKVRVHVLSENNNRVEIEIGVSDTGIGMSEEIQKKIFGTFIQADESTTRKYGGTGLGLAIVKQLVEIMGGRYGVESELNKGSLIWVSLPFETTAEKAEPVGKSQKLNIVKLSGTVLLVEDNPVNQVVATKMLDHMGLDVVIASDGEEALEYYANEPFNLVLMDCQMPVMDGFVATKKIRDFEKNNKMKPVPIIAMTANVMQGDKENCLDAGMDDYLGKPVTIAQLEEKLQRWIS